MKIDFQEAKKVNENRAKISSNKENLENVSSFQNYAKTIQNTMAYVNIMQSRAIVKFTTKR